MDDFPLCCRISSLSLSLSDEDPFDIFYSLVFSLFFPPFCTRDWDKIVCMTSPDSRDRVSPFLDVNNMKIFTHREASEWAVLFWGGGVCLLTCT